MSRKQSARRQNRTNKTGKQKTGITRTSRSRSRNNSSNKKSHRINAKNGGPPGTPSDYPTDDDAATVVLLFNKPFQVLCQFTDQDDRATLANYITIPDLYSAGRLDRDSEGLLLLTNNGMLQHRIAHPDFKLPKTYLAQVEGTLSEKALKQLCEGVKLNDGLSAPATAIRVDEPDWLWPRDPPIRFRKEVPTSWLQLTITEGRNRQVRRMSAAVGYPTLRLIRTHIGTHSVVGLAPGEQREIDATFG